MRYQILGLGFIVAVSLPVFANEYLIGRLFDEHNKPISGAEITISNTRTRSNNTGEFTLVVPESDVYQLFISKSGYYPSVQTFSRFELTRNDSSVLSFNDISLVEKRDKRVMFAFTGDTMMGRRYYKPYFGDQVLIDDENRLTDSQAILKQVKPYLSLADIATTNLETQVFSEVPGNAAPKSIAFFSKPEILEALSWAGIDYVTLGNNHTYDYRESGLVKTLEHLNISGLGYSGADINEQLALRAWQTNINSVDFGLLGYVGWEGRVTPNQIAETSKGGAAFGNGKNIIHSVADQKKTNHVPIVQYHGGYEYSNNPSGLTEQRLKTAVDNGAAVVVAHHPHVTQGLEIYRDKLIAWSMGNFVFDQYIPSTPYSFILYVWLDDDKFHRAEIVPIYLKGYIPTPATGINRYTALARIRALSEQRNTDVGISGGHGVITAEQETQKKDIVSIEFDENSVVSPIYLAPSHLQITKVQIPKDTGYRLGINLMNGSDFESFNYFDSPERSWAFDRDNTVINDYGASGTKSMGLMIKSNQASEIGLQSFRRKFKGDQPTSVVAKVKTENRAKISFYWQGRRFNQKFFQARKESEKQLIGTIDLKASMDWQSIELDFNSVRYNYPSKGFRAYRVLASIELPDGKKGKVDIDDFAVIEWQTPFTFSGEPLYTNVEAKQASYIGINKPINSPVKIVYE